MEYKYGMHVPLEQYGYISLDFEGTAEQAVEKYREIQELVKVQPKGMDKKKFDEIIDLMLEKKPIYEDPGILEEMNPQQRYGFDVVRKSLNRIAYTKTK